MSIRANIVPIVVATLFVATAKTSHSQILSIFDWNNPGGGGYSNTFNWTQFGFPLGIPDSSSELARFQIDATYSVAIDTDYTVGTLAARQQGDVTLNFPPSGIFTPRKIYATGQLVVDPTAGGAVTLQITDWGADGWILRSAEATPVQDQFPRG